MNDYDDPPCDHDEHSWRISCHDDLLSDPCRNSAQRSTYCCNRQPCISGCMGWVVAGTGHHPVRVLLKRAQTENVA